MTTSTGWWEPVRTFRSVSPARVVSGLGALAQLSRIARRLDAERTLIATNRTLGDGSALLNDVVAAIGKSQIGVFDQCREHAPLESVHALSEHLRRNGADLVVAVGGSSVFDVCKAALAGTLGENRAPPVLVAVPTTLSAGEFNPSAGLTNPDTLEKSYLVDERLLPYAVILDPLAASHTPRRLWLSTGIKAMEHAVEAVWTVGGAHPVVELSSLRALEILSSHLEPSQDAQALGHRAACQVGAWMSIASVATHGIRLSHLIGHQAGARWHISHGLTACAILPATIRFLGPATVEEQRKIGRALGLQLDLTSDVDVAGALADSVEGLVARLALPARLREVGAERVDFDAVAAATFRAASELRLTRDLPNGPDSVREVLELAW